MIIEKGKSGSRSYLARYEAALVMPGRKDCLPHRSKHAVIAGVRSVSLSRIICQYIPDDYEFMDPELIQLLEERVSPYLEKEVNHKR